jgi:hypothetical protein
MRRISQAVVDLQLLQPPPSVPPTPVETLLDAALNARLSLIAGGRARKPVVDTPRPPSPTAEAAHYSLPGAGRE